MRDRYDVIVVGARVAGSTLAALLGDRDVSVLLLDRARFPSTTPSTHFFRGAGLVGVLGRLGVLDTVLAHGCPPLARELNYEDGGRDGVEGPPQEPGDIGYCLSVRRAPLDAILLERARSSPTVDVVERATVSEVLWHGERADGVALEDGRRAHAALVVGADGRHSLVAKHVNAAPAHTAPPRRALYYRNVAGFRGPDGNPPDAEFSQLGDEIAYVVPSDAGLTCVAISVNLVTFGMLRRDLASGCAERLARHSGIAARVATSTPDGRLAGGGPEHSYVRIPHGPGWALVGDAAMHQDPWSGLGMDMAGVHATFLADAIVAWLGGSAGESTAMAGYHERRDANGLFGYHETVRYAADLRALAG